MKKVTGSKSRKLRESNQISSIRLSNNQQKYYDSLISPDISLVVALGPAGSGKTLLACQSAILALQSKEVDKIIITRPLVSVDEELGFLPGTFQAKMDPWIRPVFDILRESFTMAQIQSMIEDGLIEISPLAYMRGRTFKRSFIIADEMQNSSPNQMKMILTRIGEGSKMVITGDLFQSDRVGENGLSDFMIKYNDASLSNQIACIELGKRDVHRSSIVSTILDIYEPDIYEPDIDNSKKIDKEDKIQDEIQDKIEDEIKEMNESIFLDLASRYVNNYDDAALIPKEWDKRI